MDGCEVLINVTDKDGNTTTATVEPNDPATPNFIVHVINGFFSDSGNSTDPLYAELTDNNEVKVTVNDLDSNSKNFNKSSTVTCSGPSQSAEADEVMKKRYHKKPLRYGTHGLTTKRLVASLKHPKKRRQLTANTIGNLATLDHEIEIVRKEGFTRGNKLSSLGTFVGFIAWGLIIAGRAAE